MIYIRVAYGRFNTPVRAAPRRLDRQGDRMNEGRADDGERWAQDPRWVGEGLNENGLVLFFDVWSGTPGTRMHMMALNANLTPGSTERNFSRTSGMQLGCTYTGLSCRRTMHRVHFVTKSVTVLVCRREPLCDTKLM